MKLPFRLLIGTLLAAALLIGSLYLACHGIYGWTLFLVIPSCVGAIASAIVRPATGAEAVKLGFITGLLGCCLFLLLGAEGVLCIAMSLPVVVPLTVLGSWLAYEIGNGRDTQTGIAMTLLLPLSLWFDVSAKPPVFAVRTAMVVNAPPEQVWKHVVAFSEIPEPDNWLFHTGLAYPKRARIEGSGPGAVRYCDFSTGTFVEPIDVWDEPHRLAFRVASIPPPMVETSLYGRIYPKHLSGYFVSRHGEFRLTSLAPGRTLLVGSTWYSHGLWPAEYWRWWSDAIIHRIHLRVLNHIKALAEREPAAE